jgi:HK97 family phage prohead protease
MLTQGFSYAYAGPVLLKDIDGAGRTVVYYGSAFHNKDSDGDVAVPGAYAKTIAENGPKGSGRIKHLRQHQTQLIIGKITEMSEDSKGLLITSVLTNDSNGKDALALYELDLFEHSIGYRTVKQQFDKNTNTNYLQEIALREVSAVTWGANGDTPLVGMKCDTKAALEVTQARIQEREAKLIKALRHGSITDNLGEQLADELEAIQLAYKGLISLNGEPLKPADATSEADEPSGKTGIKSFLQLI